MVYLSMSFIIVSGYRTSSRYVATVISAHFSCAAVLFLIGKISVLCIP